MSSSSHVKDSIVQLCKMFKYGKICGCIAPEHFRQAKHSKSDAIIPMKELLLSLTLFLTENKNKSNVYFLMKEFRYPRLHLIPTSDDSSITSCELLLCVAWVLHCSKIIELLRDHAIANCNTFTVLLKQKPMPEKDYTSNKLPVSLENKGRSVQSKGDFKEGSMTKMVFRLRHENFSSLCMSNQMRYIVWLFGKLEISANRLYSITAKSTKLKEEIHTKIQAKSTDAAVERKPAVSSLDELILIKHPRIAKQCEKELEDKVHFIQAYLKWKDLQSTFWEWISDAVDGTTTAVTDASAVNDENNIVKVENCECLNNSLKQLDAEIAEMRNDLFKRHKLWLELIKEKPSVLSKVRIEQKLEVENEVDKVFKMMEKITDSPQLVSKEYAIAKNTFSLSFETKLIKKEVDNLRFELLKMQQLWKDELTMITSTELPEQACFITPESTKT